MLSKDDILKCYYTWSQKASSQRAFPSAVIRDRFHPAPELLTTQTGSCSLPAVYSSQVSEVCWLALDLYRSVKSCSGPPDFSWRLAHLSSIPSQLKLILYGRLFRPSRHSPIPWHTNLALTPKRPCSFSFHSAFYLLPLWLILTCFLVWRAGSGILRPKVGLSPSARPTLR